MTKPGPDQDKTASKLPFRIGHGVDVHRFADNSDAGSHITLGGVSISHSKKLLAHSDGDVLIHALCDAMLGAIAAGDIGQHFPDTDAQYRDIDSTQLLQRVDRMVADAGYKTGNIDITIIAQAPKMSAYISAMRERIAQLLCVSMNQINVKATTTEGLGYVGRQEGIAVHAVVIVYKF
jgi:2-C-methyl-D-erythritol 2,4-cyclodiphosphate synthase